MGVSRANIEELVNFCKSYFVQDEGDMAEVWILTAQRPGSGAN